MQLRADPSRVITAPRGTERSARSWLTEAPLRMLMNNLDPDVAERPDELVVYGGIGRAARDWECFDRILATLKELDDDESLALIRAAVSDEHPMVRGAAAACLSKRGDRKQGLEVLNQLLQSENEDERKAGRTFQDFV